MDPTPHSLLVSHGAEAFAREQGFAFVDQAALVTDESRAELARFQSQYARTVGSLFNISSTCVDASASTGHDTVGAVALDARGNLACGTSTGGITGKRVGRVGDSPLVGCGGLAETGVGACSTTGHGESIIAATLASHVVFHLQQQPDPGVAAEQAVRRMHARTRGRGGVVVLNGTGDAGHFASTQRMAWASATGTLGHDPHHSDAGVDNDDAYNAIQ